MFPSFHLLLIYSIRDEMDLCISLISQLTSVAFSGKGKLVLHFSGRQNIFVK